MKQVPSAQFRLGYAKLLEPVEVTVQGHKIGTYFPGNTFVNPDPTSVARSTDDADFIRPTSQAHAQRSARGLMDLQRKALGAPPDRKRK